MICLVCFILCVCSTTAGVEKPVGDLFVAREIGEQNEGRCGWKTRRLPNQTAERGILTASNAS